MAYSSTKCQSLADQIANLEDVLNRLAAGEAEIMVQDGATSIRYQGTSVAKVEARLHRLRSDYFNGLCPVTLGNDDILPSKPRRALRPIVGHN